MLFWHWLVICSLRLRTSQGRLGEETGAGSIWGPQELGFVLRRERPLLEARQIQEPSRIKADQGV